VRTCSEGGGMVASGKSLVGNHDTLFPEAENICKKLTLNLLYFPAVFRIMFSLVVSQSTEARQWVASTNWRPAVLVYYVMFCLFWTLF